MGEFETNSLLEKSEEVYEDESKSWFYEIEEDKLLYYLIGFLFMVFFAFFSSGMVFSHEICQEKYVFIDPFKGYYSQNADFWFSGFKKENRAFYLKFSIVRIPFSSFKNKYLDHSYYIHYYKSKVFINESRRGPISEVFEFNRNSFYSPRYVIYNADIDESFDSIHINTTLSSDFSNCFLIYFSWSFDNPSFHKKMPSKIVFLPIICLTIIFHFIRATSFLEEPFVCKFCLVMLCFTFISSIPLTMLYGMSDLIILFDMITGSILSSCIQLFLILQHYLMNTGYNNPQYSDLISYGFFPVVRFAFEVMAILSTCYPYFSFSLFLHDLCNQLNLIMAAYLLYQSSKAYPNYQLKILTNFLMISTSILSILQNTSSHIQFGYKNCAWRFSTWKLYNIMQSLFMVFLWQVPKKPKTNL